MTFLEARLPFPTSSEIQPADGSEGWRAAREGNSWLSTMEGPKGSSWLQGKARKDHRDCGWFVQLEEVTRLLKTARDWKLIFPERHRVTP